MGQMAETEQESTFLIERVSLNKFRTFKLISVEKTTISAMLAKTGGILKVNFMLLRLLLLLLSLLLFFITFTVLYKKQAFYWSFSVSNFSAWSYV